MENYELTKEEKEAKNRYLREWRRKNPERARELNRRSQKRYWQRVAQQNK